MRHRRTPQRPRRADFVEKLEDRLFLARLTGIDVSHFQGTMNWNTAVSRGLSFAFIRASRGDTVPDTQLANNMHPTNGAKAKGLVVGVYHRILPYSNTADSGAWVDPIVEANKFLTAGGNYMGPGYMRPVVDVENGSKMNTTPVNGYNLSTWVLAFVNRIKEVKNVTPIIYTGHYRSYLNSSVVSALPDLWIANWNQTSYGDPVTGTGGPPTSPWNPSPNWKFWQYDSPNGLGSYYGAQSTDIDLNVFNGDNINVLKQNFVIGAARIPSGPSPASGAGSVSPFGLKLDWADSLGATAYDVYLNNTLVASNLATSEWTPSSQLAGGTTHQWRVVAKGVIGDDDTHTTTTSNWSFTTTSVPLPGVPSGGMPNGVFMTSKPFVLDWDDAPNAATYDVYLGTNVTPTYTDLTSSQTPSINPADGVRQWRVVAKNASGSTSGPQWSYTMDSVAPAAVYGAQAPTAGTSFLDFTITYSDATSGVDFTTIDSSDVYVTGPNDYSQSATLIGVDVNANGSPRVATYRIDAPGGTWDAADNGGYVVNLNASQVKDVAGLSVVAGPAGAFNVELSQAFAYKVGSVLHVDFDGTTTPIALSHSSGTFFASRNGTTLDFTDVTAVVGNGTMSDDLLHIGSAVPVPLTFNNQDGNDSVTVIAGAVHTFDTDLSPVPGSVDLIVEDGATAIFASSQHLDELILHGTATVAAGGDKVLVVRSLAFEHTTSRLDLADNDLIIDYNPGDPSPIGSSDGVTYSGIAGRIQSGRNGGAWNGASGIITSQPDAPGGLTTLGSGEASAVLGLTGAQTGTFSGQTVDATAVLVKYTYVGDANMDGFISGDDYGAIDFAFGVPGSADFANGDFNYDGIISGDDYSAIDFNLSAQGDPL